MKVGNYFDTVNVKADVRKYEKFHFAYNKISRTDIFHRGVMSNIIIYICMNTQLFMYERVYFIFHRR